MCVKMIKRNKVLSKTKVYLIGNIQFNDSINLDWRETVEKEFAKLNITCLNPLKNTFINFEVEGKNIQESLNGLLKRGHYNLVHESFKQIIRRDTACVDRADFVVAYIKPKISTFGTIHEIVLATQLHKPVFIIIDGGYKNLPLWLCGLIDKKSYIYSSVKNLVDMITKINDNKIKLDSKKWRLLHYYLR